MGTIFRKVEIKSESDLPKEASTIYLHVKNNIDLRKVWSTHQDILVIVKDCDWYLIEEAEPAPVSAKQYFMQKCNIDTLDDLYTLHYSELFQWMEEYRSQPQEQSKDETVSYDYSFCRKFVNEWLWDSEQFGDKRVSELFDLDQCKDAACMIKRFINLYVSQSQGIPTQSKPSDLRKELIKFLLWYDEPRIKHENSASEVIAEYLLSK